MALIFYCLQFKKTFSLLKYVISNRLTTGSFFLDKDEGHNLITVSLKKYLRKSICKHLRYCKLFISPQLRPISFKVLINVWDHRDLKALTCSVIDTMEKHGLWVYQRKKIEYSRLVQSSIFPKSIKFLCKMNQWKTQ